MSDAANSEKTVQDTAYRVVRGMLTIMFFWVFFKFGGFILNVIIGRLYGSGVEAQAYFFACQAVVYMLIFSTGLKVVIPAFMPLFIEEKTGKGEQRAWDFASTILNLIILASVVLIIAFLLGAKPITSTLVRGFSEEEQHLGVRLLRFVMPGTIVMTASWLMTAVLNSYKNFGYSPAADATQKLLWAGAVFVTYKYLNLGVYAIALGFLVGCGGQIVVLLIGWRHWLGNYRLGFPALRSRTLGREIVWLALFLISIGIAVRVITASVMEKWRDLAVVSAIMGGGAVYVLTIWQRCRHRSSTIARFCALAAPLLMSALFARYRDVVTYYFQSFTLQGVYADIEFARKIAMLPPVIVSYTLSIAMFPYLCELAIKDDSVSLSDILNRTLKMLALGFVPLTVMIILLSGPIVRLAYDPGDLPQIHNSYRALSLQILVMALVFYAIENVVLQAFFSLQKMWWPTLMGIVATFAHFCILAIPIYGFGMDSPSQIFFCVALAFPVSRIFKNTILLFVLNKKVKLFKLADTLKFLLKLSVVTAVTGGLAWLVSSQLAGRLPMDDFTEKRAVIDRFGPHPGTWMSLNARTLELKEENGSHWLSLSYPRGMRIKSELERSLTFMRPKEISGVSLRLRSSRRISKLRVLLIDSRGRAHMAPAPELQPSSGPWTDISVNWNEPVSNVQRVIIEDASAESTDLPPDMRENLLELDAVQLLGSDGRIAWNENFDGHYWSTEPKDGTFIGKVGPEKKNWALVIKPWAESVTRDIESINLGVCTRLKLKVFVSEVPTQPIEIKIVDANGQERSHHRRIHRVGWNRLDMALSAFRGKASMVGVAPAAGTALKELTLTLPDRSGDWAVRDLYFHDPATFRYEIVKFLHCALPSAAGLAGMLLTAFILRMEELRAIVQWVRKRGWKKQKGKKQSADAIQTTE